MQSRKIFKRRGQALVLYALLIPLLFLFVGMGIDLGWYFLNVSRLQNAADAAALAGAWKLVEVDEDYWPVALSKPPSDLKEYNVFYVWNSTTGQYEKKDVTKTAVLEGKAEAIFYANKNLISVGTDNINTERNLSKTKVLNEWSTKNNLSNVAIKTTLYGKNIDIEYEKKNNISSSGTKYYEVTLTEDISHLFLAGLDPMNATVVSYVMLTPHDKSLIESIKPLEETKTIHNWEYQNKYHNFTGNWNHYRQTVAGSQSDGKNIVYEEGDNFRTETLNVTPDKSKSSAFKTSANGGKIYDMDDTDSINIDFNQDFVVSKYVTEDWDLRSTSTPNGATITYRGKAGWDENHGYDLRIQGLINFNGAWDNRKLKDSNVKNDLDADVMWTRIESDPMWSKDVPWGNQNTLNSVRQMIINAHVSNAKVVDTGLKDTDGNSLKAYEKRPFFIFYMGPEINEPNNPNPVRKSQPVILNLYEDWNAILYMPNSPVIINGNGHKLTGFVIAKEYHRLLTEDDFKTENKYKDYIKATDEYGNTIFVKKSDTFSEDDLKIESFDEAYVKALKKYRNLSDSDFSTITFEKDGYTTKKTFRVATEDLLSPEEVDKTNSKYVKVFVGNTERYIEKTKLPYVKIYRNKHVPYVPICDIKFKKKDSDYAGVTLVKDDTPDGLDETAAKSYFLENKDSKFVLRTLTDFNSGGYEKTHGADKINKVVDEDGCKYFTFKSDDTSTKYFIGDVDYLIKSQYRRIVTSDGETRYIDDNDNNITYYVKVVPEGSYKTDDSGNIIESNPIIIDNKGDLQSVPLDVSKVTRAPKDPEEIPRDRGMVIDGKYRRSSTASRDKDYRIPEYEVVYDAQKAFNLSPTSCYSYFNIPELIRVNYLYLNNDELNHVPADNWDVKDMFFTTIRANWID